jgi:hypothetical protein
MMVMMKLVIGGFQVLFLKVLQFSQVLFVIFALFVWMSLWRLREMRRI